MNLLSRRKMLKNAALPIAGTFALPSLAAAVQEVSTSYQRPKLKITDVRTAQVRVHGLQTHVRIYTDQDSMAKVSQPTPQSEPHHW
jgi:hypothetical protein